MAKTQVNKEMAKAKLRLNNIVKRFKGEKITQHIDLRSRKMRKAVKLEAWISLLESKNYFSCANRASQWLKLVA